MSTAALDLSVAVIACDNERTIGRTMASVEDLARRIVVVDSGSRDGTIEICRGHGAEVIHHDWEGYGRQKQFALDRCDTGWVLSLDSDESVDADLAAAIRRVIESEAAEVLGIPYDEVTQCALIPVAYYTGEGFKPGPRKPLDPILHVDEW